jgi:hypothetical protein
MNFSDLAAIGGFLGSVAVCGSLVYLALQVRQSDRNQRALMTQGIITRGTGIIMFMAQPLMSDLVARINAGETDFSSSEIIQLNLALRLLLADLQDAYVQRKNGLADETSFDSIRQISTQFLSFPVMRVLWLGARPTFPSEFAGVVDELTRALPLAEPVDLAARLKNGLAAIRGPGRAAGPSTP